MVETGGRGTVVRGHPPGRRAPDGGHRERGRYVEAAGPSGERHVRLSRQRDHQREPEGLRPARHNLPRHNQREDRHHRQPAAQQARQLGFRQVRLEIQRRHRRCRHRRGAAPQPHPVPDQRGQRVGRDRRSQAGQVHLPGHRHHARHHVQVEPQARVPQRGPGRQHAGHDRHARSRGRAGGNPHHFQRHRQGRREVHHDHHARHRAGRQMGDLYRHLHRHLDHDPLHVQERQGLQRPGPRLHRRGQLRRRPKLRQGVQARLRLERRSQDRREQNQRERGRQGQACGRQERRTGIRNHRGRPQGADRHDRQTG